MAAKKVDTLASEKFQDTEFDLFAALAAVDKKDYGWYSRLTGEQKRKFTAYMLVHWMSAVGGGGTLQSYYLLSTNAVANTHLLDENIQRHPGLQWLMLCAASPGVGKQYHQWIPHLPEKYGLLKEKLPTKTVAEYLSKVYKGSSREEINNYAGNWAEDQNHKYRISRLLPTAKLGDIEVLGKLLSAGDLDEYERRSGG